MIHNSSSITDFSRFIEAISAPVQSHHVEIDLNHKAYKILLEIEFERNQIKNLTSGSQGIDVSIHQNLLAELRSDIQRKSDELFLLIQQSSQCMNLGHKDSEDLDASAPECYTEPQTTEELLKEVELYDAVILMISQKFFNFLTELNEEDAEQILTVNPNIMLRLYNLPQSDQRDELLEKVMFQESNLAALASFGQEQRSFVLSPAGIIGSYKRIFNYDWVNGQSLEALSFLSNVEIMGSIIRNSLSVNTVISIFQKFGKEDAEIILKGGVESEKDLEAWDSLSKEELQKLRRTVDSRLEGIGWSNSEIIRLFKESPRKHSVFLNARVEKVISASGYSRAFFEKLYHRDRDKFSALTHKNMLTLLCFRDFNTLFQIYDENRLLFHFFTADNSLRIINAIGFESAQNLFVNQFHAFVAMYNLGECFQVVNYNEIPRLVHIHRPQEAHLSPKVDMRRSEVASFWVEVAKLPKKVTPPPPPPSRRESYQATVASSSSSSLEL